MKQSQLLAELQEETKSSCLLSLFWAWSPCRVGGYIYTAGSTSGINRADLKRGVSRTRSKGLIFQLLRWDVEELWFDRGLRWAQSMTELKYLSSWEWTNTNNKTLITSAKSLSSGFLFLFMLLWCFHTHTELGFWLTKIKKEASCGST